MMGSFALLLLLCARCGGGSLCVLGLATHPDSASYTEPCPLWFIIKKPSIYVVLFCIIAAVPGARCTGLCRGPSQRSGRSLCCTKWSRKSKVTHAAAGRQGMFDGSRNNKMAAKVLSICGNSNSVQHPMRSSKHLVPEITSPWHLAAESAANRAPQMVGHKNERGNIRMVDQECEDIPWLTNNHGRSMRQQNNQQHVEPETNTPPKPPLLTCSCAFLTLSS